MENKFSGNYFQLTVCFEGFDPEMVWSENFHFKPFPDSRAKREKEPSTSTLSIYEPITPSTLPTSHPSISPTSHAFNFTEIAPKDRTPSTSHLSTSPTSHAFDFTKVAPRRLWSHWDRNWEMVGFWWIWPNLMNFFLLGFVSVFIYWEMVLYICLEAEKMWGTKRKCVSILFSATQPNTRKYFPKHFLECNQTLENIFISWK